VILKFDPDPGDIEVSPMEYEFSPDALLSAEAELIEDAGGTAWATYDEFRTAFRRSKLRALRAAYWIILRRDDPGLPLSAVTVKPRQLSWEHSETDLLEIRQNILDATDITEEQRQSQLQLIDTLLGPASPPASVQAEEDADPKVPGSNASEPSLNEPQPDPPASEPSAPSTGGRSRSTSAARPRSKTPGASRSSKRPATSSTS
jgi:hypothetical protein